MPTHAELPPGHLMAAEIAEQPAVLARLLADGAAEIAILRARIEAFRPRSVLIAARGTSDHAALYAKYLVEVRQQLPAGLVSPSTLTLYGARPDLAGVLFLAVSQSGGSPDLVGSVEVARSCGAMTVAVTNDAASALAAAAEHHVDIRAGAERAVAATKTYTAELLALYLLICDGHAAAVPEAADRTLALAPTAYAAAERYRSVQRLVTIGRGYSYPTVREAALKLMETCYLSAQAFSGADLLHGPLAMIGREVPAIVVATPGIGGTAMQPVLARLAEIGADVLRIGADVDDLSEGHLPVVVDGLAEELHPIVEILPLQQLAWRLALDRGGDPDHPRGLSKVTRTW